MKGAIHPYAIGFRSIVDEDSGGEVCVARYLLAATPLAGHLMPMLAIAVDLQRRGHAVRLMTGREHHDAVARLGITPVALPREAHPQHAPAAESVLRSPSMFDLWRAGRTDMRAVFIEPMMAQYRALEAELANGRVDAVLADIAFTGVLPMLLGERARPRIVVCGVGPLTLSSVDTPAFGSGWQPQPGMNYGGMNWAVHHVLFADVQARLDAALRKVGARRSPVFLTDWPRLADRLLQLTVPSAEYPRTDLPATVVFTGPIVTNSSAEVEPLPPWWERATKGRTVVHVTQGTYDNRDLSQLIGPTLQALAHRHDLAVVATTGRPDSMAYTGPIPPNAHVVGFLPYGSLLPHVDVMITNGGYGGVQQALRHGIPLIVAGRTADKPEVAARVEFSGAGINLKTSTPSVRAIGDAVHSLLARGRHRAAATRISREMSAATPFDTIAEVLGDLQAADVESALPLG